jgi:hypothetical protein
MNLRGGPVNASYQEFLSHDFSEKLTRLQDGRFAVMCTGLRDMFLHASAGVPGLRARPVEAFNYSPPISDLIPYSHSTAEVWVSKLNRWILFDPWVGIALERDGSLLSTSDLAIADPQSTSVVPILRKVQRFNVNARGKVETIVLDPAQTKLVEYSFTPIGHAPGYLYNFRALLYRDFTLKS